MSHSKHTKKAVATEFVEWVNGQRDLDLIPEDLVERWVESFVECNWMFAYGKGHQSRSICQNTTPGHHYHVFENIDCDVRYPFDYPDSRISDQTYTRPSDGKVFHLIFNDEGWM